MRITPRTILDIVEAKLRPLRARLTNVTTRGVVVTLDDSTGLARGQTSTGATQTADDIEFISPFGISSRPPAGAESISWSIGSSATHLLAMIFDRRIRLKGTLAAGEVALHIGVANQLVHLQADGTVVVRAGTDGGTVTVKPNGDVVILPGAGGNVYLGDGSATKRVALADEVDARFASVRATFNTHVHAGVTVGLGSTAVTPSLIAALAPTASTNVFGAG